MDSAALALLAVSRREEEEEEEGEEDRSVQRHTREELSALSEDVQASTGGSGAKLEGVRRLQCLE
jgi:hypothetical protein